MTDNPQSSASEGSSKPVAPSPQDAQPEVQNDPTVTVAETQTAPSKAHPDGQPEVDAAATGTKREASDAGNEDTKDPASNRENKRARSSRGRDSRLNRGRGGHRQGTRDDKKGKDSGPEGEQQGEKKDTRKDLNQGRNYNPDRGGRTEGEDGDGEARLPKRKVAVQFGYCGEGYSGLQVNPGVKTIEGDLFDSFCKLGAISAANSVNPTKVNLQRSARTDRGVHAAGNLISLKLITESPEIKNENELVKRANETLPEYIRVWSISRVQNSFDARISCDSRRYEYLLPTYVFVPPKPGCAMYKMVEKMREEAGQDAGLEGAPGWDAILKHPFWAEQGTEHTFAEDIGQKRKWRLPADHLARIRATFNKYLGSHNFHNFTVEKAFTDRSSQRVMKHLSVSDPMEINGTEWLSIKLHGQSFMFHQIRKMVAILVLICRMNVPPSFILETFGPAKIHTPKAPALGLLLEYPLFDGYNRRIISSNQQVEKKKRTVQTKPNLSEAKREEEITKLDTSVRELIRFDQHEGAMEAFKKKFIYDFIFKTEQKTTEFGKWLNCIDVYQGSDFEYLNPKGVIPQAAILRLGEYRRPDPKPKGEKQADPADTKEESDDEAPADEADES